MPNRVSSDYKLRVVWDELSHRHYKDVALYNRPHVEAFLRSRFGQFVIDHVQNFCWTIERLLSRRQNIAPKPRDAEVVANETFRPDDGPRIFLDITHTSRGRQNTGIQRVCRRLAEEALRSGLFVPTALQDGRLHSLDHSGAKTPVDVRPQDMFVILDMFWDPLREYLDFIAHVRQRGVVVATCFYDIVPSLHPEICAVDFSATFTADLEAIYDVTDVCVAISKATLDDLKEVLSRSRDVEIAAKKFVFFHLGADFAAKAPPIAGPRPATRAFDGDKTFLSVGTIEPKKGYDVTLDAFEILWSKGLAVSLVIIGKYGWSAEALRSRIENHVERGKRLFWFDQASDDLLNEAYRKAYCFIQASVAEGFGIPVIEAAKHEIPVIASDIDVFKEIGGDDLIYFQSENPRSLSDKIIGVLETRPITKEWAILSWQASSQELHKVLSAALADRRTVPLSS